jgi:hypothetical protein
VRGKASITSAGIGRKQPGLAVESLRPGVSPRAGVLEAAGGPDIVTPLANMGIDRPMGAL